MSSSSPQEEFTKRPFWKRPLAAGHDRPQRQYPPSDAADSKGTAKTGTATTQSASSSASRLPQQYADTITTATTAPSTNNSILFQGLFAQDFCEHGQDADPTICLLAAQQFLVKLRNLHRPPPGLMDTLIERGAYFHHKFRHLTLPQILRQREEDQPYAKILCQFAVQRPLLASAHVLAPTLRHIPTLYPAGQRVAVFLLTPAGQTYLYVKREEGILLFDCRGKPGAVMKSAYLERFTDEHALVTELQRLSPVGGGRGVLGRLSPTDVNHYTLVTMVARRR